MLLGQRSFFGGGAPSVDATFARLRREALDATGWVAHAPPGVGGPEGVALPRASLAYYRHGRDSVAWHGDYVAREMDEALVATVSVGEPRKFLLRPAGGGRRSIAFNLGWGDLLVM